ncbi:MAG: hypothetical protein AAF492_20810, partial [Verrucomicrobiota bacterium]
MDDHLNADCPFPDDRFEGRGIVLCGGGEAYFPSIWVCVNMLRSLGCRLPIELWYLGRAEMNRAMIELLEPLDVVARDAFAVEKTYPMERLGGWELKPYALVHSRFEDVLYIDADNVPLRNPEFLFESAAFKKTGALFWPDRCRNAEGQNFLSRKAWDLLGLPYRDEPEFESGQLVLRKKQVWKALQLTLHLNSHSDFYYRYFYGDKDTFHLAWRRLEQPFQLMPHPPQSLKNDLGMVQFDENGDALFCHLCALKWNLHHVHRDVAEYPFAEPACRFLIELRRVWNGEVRPLPSAFSDSEKAAFEEIVSFGQYRLVDEKGRGHVLSLAPSFALESGEPFL